MSISGDLISLDILLTKREKIVKRLRELADENMVLPYGSLSRVSRELGVTGVSKYAKDAGFLVAPRDTFIKERNLLRLQKRRKNDGKCLYCGRYLIGLDSRRTRWCSLHSALKYKQELYGIKRRYRGTRYESTDSPLCS